MKILLTHPRFEPNTNPHLGIAYIAANMRKHGIEVEVLDATFGGWKIAKERLQKADYDILGIGTFTANHLDGLKMAEIAKKANPKALVVFGGVHPTIFPEQTAREKNIDIVVYGEGEETFVELFNAVKNKESFDKVQGICFKRGKKVIKNPPRPLIENLDGLPFPARDLMSMQKYLDAQYGRSAWAVKAPSTSIMASRGCPFKCAYCSSYLMFGRRTRFRSAKNIVDEIEHLVKTYKIKGLSFLDDTFTLRKALVQEVCGELLRRNIKIEWIANSRVDTIDFETLKKMKEAGCVAVAFGVESGSQYVLDELLDKKIKIEQIKKAFKWAKKAGLHTDAYFMIGIPGEKMEHLKESAKLAKELDADAVNFSIARPLPGTKMHDMAEKLGKLKVIDWNSYDFNNPPIYECSEFDSDKIKEIQKQLYRSYYFSPKYILKQLLSIRSFAHIKQKLKGLYMVIKSST